ncbi:hypothetical protein OF117_04945 [Geodermatophilus sp. YIM 151500]|uniref:hypothetical protein n=1 Tax=Geodermatophilus sp. YIM 151500 TaxID=2984531 RepID=UPI0021E35D6A|nr:hypothetical protein [Geodermatophilus sp. YIM 151500]MCV2488701.1 hypothetical protein [Geodermatophilus sp. YIM 151500]
MLVPSADTFTALARSSPWRWSTLRFTVRWSGPYQTWPEPVRAWLRRPDVLRVETLGGHLVQIVRERRSTAGVMTPEGGRTVEIPWPGDPGAPSPELRPDGLVAGRTRPFELSDDPMFQDYRWVSVLDPVELADGRDPATDEPVPALAPDAVVEVEHAGRPAWEAVVRTTPGYEPRCGCCPLLRDRRVDELEWGPGAAQLPAVYPEAHRVRLDVGTGVCVLTEQIGGSTAGAGHDLRIEAVDEPMDEELFTEPPRRHERSGPPRPGWAPRDQ